MVLNVGSDDGIAENDKFIVYGLEEEDIIDPETGKSLGKLEMYRGRGAVVFVYDKICVIEAISNPFLSTDDNFVEAKVGDYAKKIHYIQKQEKRSV